jgi:hypothetical protein
LAISGEVIGQPAIVPAHIEPMTQLFVKLST